MNRAKRRGLRAEQLENRLLLTGDIDLSYGTNGIVLDNTFHDQSGEVALAVQPDAKTVLAGRGEQQGTLRVARYDTDGNLDPNFASGGYFEFDLRAQFDPLGIVNVTDIELAPAGEIYVGVAYQLPAVIGGGPSNLVRSDMHVYRLNATGSLDTSFDGDGVYVDDDQVALSTYGPKLSVQSDGKLVLAAAQFDELAGFNGDSVLVQRHNTDGSLDTSFATSGEFNSTFTFDAARTSDVMIQPDGKIVAIGGAINSGSAQFLAIRFLTDGSLDTSFDSDGVAVSDSFGALGVEGAIGPDGRLTIAGSEPVSRTTALTRFNADGSLDTDFGVNGYLDIGQTGLVTVELIVQADGKAILSGAVFDTPTDGFIARLDATGAFDPTFGTNGIISVNDDTVLTSSVGHKVIALPDGNLLFAGTQSSGIFLTQYSNDVMPPNNFVDLTDGTLTITGTADDNDIVVALDGTKVTVSSDYFVDVCYDVSDIDVVLIDSGDGDDSIEVGNNLTLPTFIDAGDGNDTVLGGGGTDVIRGGNGNDTIRGRRGDDILLGQDGEDVLRGNRGRDIIIGGDDVDRMEGGQDEDILIGGLTVYESNDDALLAILDEWSSNRSRFRRQINIFFGVGPVLGGTGYRLRFNDTIFSDGDNDISNTYDPAEDWLL